jgi:hypothetical protein
LGSLLEVIFVDLFILGDLFIAKTLYEGLRNPPIIKNERKPSINIFLFFISNAVFIIINKKRKYRIEINI